MIFRKKNFGFTLVEMLVVITILGIFTASASRLYGMNRDAKFYRETVKRVLYLRSLIVGDERILQSGRRFDFGFFGARNGAFPPNSIGSEPGILDLRTYDISPDPYFYHVDVWGTRYTYPGLTSGIKEITSSASPRTLTNPGTLADDITVTIREADYDDNDVVIFVKDVNGTLLRGIDHAATTDRPFHIRRVEFSPLGSTSYDHSHIVQTLGYSKDGYWFQNGVNAGPCTVEIWAADGDNAKNSTVNWTHELFTSYISSLKFREVIYPTGGYTTNNTHVNYIEIRVPGTVSEFGGHIG